MIENYALLDSLALASYATYMYFSFCDGFNLKSPKKAIWGTCFIVLCLWSIMAEGYFRVEIIILWSSIVAFILARIQKRDNSKR